jgi:8-oxo-dGTP diphosphatase
MPPSNTPLLATDCVVIDSAGRVLLIRRKRPPYEGALALPGGLVEIGETVDDACRRELLEETGLEVGSLRLVGVYSEPGRDPRGHVCSVAFLSQIDRAAAVAGDDAASVEWVRDWKRSSLAFDHRKIIDDAVQLAAGHPQA